MRPLVLLSALALTACSDPGCTNDILSQSISPDGKTKLILFSRNCGATTGPNTHAMLLPRDGKLTQAATGNAFIIDQGSATASWKDPDHLVITLAHGTRVFKQEPSVQGITITYQPGIP